LWYKAPKKKTRMTNPTKGAVVEDEDEDDEDDEDEDEDDDDDATGEVKTAATPKKDAKGLSTKAAEPVSVVDDDEDDDDDDE
jgi:hypothetical protein